MISIITSTISLDQITVKRIIADYNAIKDAGVNFELIIQDCQSDLDLLKQLENLPYTSIRSELDSGIYDAWNRALPRIKGDKVCFLGVDDFPLYDWLICADELTLDENEVVVCDVNYIDNNGCVVGIYKNPRESKLDMRIAKYLHPGFIFSAKFYKKTNFKPQYKIIGDGLFYSKMPFAILKRHFNKSGVNMTIGGTSNSPLGARKRMYEYIAAFRDRDIDNNFKMYSRFIIENLPQYLLSFIPRIYKFIQLLRMQFKYKILTRKNSPYADINSSKFFKLP
jgi:hypothetical protein